ncbi:MAG: hypothetical protein ACKPEN_13615, partial [Planktothrix sp.]
QIRDLSKQEFLALRELCRLSKNLYNVGLYSVRQFYFSEQRYLRYESNNGAANIRKKSSHNGFTGVGRGCLTQPLRVKIS